MKASGALSDKILWQDVPVIQRGELDRLDCIIDKYAGQSRYLIPALKEAQEIFGYLPEEVQRRLARGFGIPASRVYGVVTFYSFFSMTPRGRHTVRLCLGTACYVKGSKDVLASIVEGAGADVGQTSHDGRFTVEAVRCLGACGLAPVMLVDGCVHAGVTPRDAMRKLDAYQ